MGVPQLPMVKAVGAYDAASSRCVNSKIARLPLKTPVTLYSATRRRARKCCGGLQTGISPDFLGTNLSRGEWVPIHELRD